MLDHQTINCNKVIGRSAVLTRGSAVDCRCCFHCSHCCYCCCCHVLSDSLVTLSEPATLQVHPLQLTIEMVRARLAVTAGACTTSTTSTDDTMLDPDSERTHARRGVSSLEMRLTAHHTFRTVAGALVPCTQLCCSRKLVAMAVYRSPNGSTRPQLQERLCNLTAQRKLHVQPRQ